MNADLKTEQVSKCAEMVYKSQSGWGRRYQCERKAGHGPESKYCAQHAEKYTAGETVTWYRADCWTDYSFGISEVQVLKETSSTLLVKGPTKATRENKVTDSYRYFPTRDAAISYYRDKVESLRRRARGLEDAINKAASESA